MSFIFYFSVSPDLLDSPIPIPFHPTLAGNVNNEINLRLTY